MSRNRFMLVLGLLVAISMVIAACGPKIVSTEPGTTAATAAPAKPSFSTPHPILSDLRVRQALAYCTDKLSLLAAAYPLNAPEANAALVMNTFIPTAHWAYAKDDPNLVIYEFDPEKGGQLLDEAGWTVNEDDGYRYNANGDAMVLHFTTTNATFRQTWAAVWEKQMKSCGILIIRQHVPASWWFGDTTGVKRRDYELGAFAWVGQPDPGGQTLYACDQIPTVENGWTGQNGMGWCNELASNNIKIANNTLVKQERIDAYRIVQEEFAKDVPSIPLFNRSSYYAWNIGFQGIEIYPGDQDYFTWNPENWQIEGKDTIVLGFTQEPSTLFQPVVDAFVAKLAGQLVSGLAFTSHNYDYQARQQTQLSTIENGLAAKADVEVNTGDTVVDANGGIVVLDPAAGQLLKNSAGETITFDGTAVTMPQLTVTYAFNEGLTFSDVFPLAQEDLELGYQIQCDRAIGATSYILCDMVKDITFSGLSYTITWWPGRLDPTYFLAPFGWYPAHQVVTAEGTYQGMTLKQVADTDASAFTTLPETTEKPMDVGPYMIDEWVKGEYIKYVVNPYFCETCVGNPNATQPLTPTIIISIIAPENAEAQLLAGQVDMLESSTIISLSQTLKDAADAGQIVVFVAQSTTWEHIDINMYLK